MAVDALNNNASLSGLLSSGETRKTTKNLDQNAFLDLLVAQLKNQDPLNPQENSEFVAQLAQFGTLDGVTGLQKEFSKLTSAMQSNQALQASSLVGRKVFVPGSTATLPVDGQPLTVSIEIDQPTTEIKASILNSKGELVQQMQLGSQDSTGSINLMWDGRDGQGVKQSAGEYMFKVDGKQTGKAVQLKTLVGANVDSVVVGKGNNAPTLNVHGVGPIELNQVNEIG